MLWTQVLERTPIVKEFHWRNNFWKPMLKIALDAGASERQRYRKKTLDNKPPGKYTEELLKVQTSQARCKRSTHKENHKCQDHAEDIHTHMNAGRSCWPACQYDLHVWKHGQQCLHVIYVYKDTYFYMNKHMQRAPSCHPCRYASNKPNGKEFPRTQVPDITTIVKRVSRRRCFSENPW